jgi:hypothetical protein
MEKSRLSVGKTSSAKIAVCHVLKAGVEEAGSDLHPLAEARQRQQPSRLYIMTRVKFGGALMPFAKNSQIRKSISDRYIDQVVNCRRTRAR